MATKLRAVLSSILLTLAISPILCQEAFGDEFTADMIEQSAADTVSGKIYAKGSNYRIEIQDEGKPMVILVDQDTNITRICDTTEKTYMEIPSDDLKSLMNDPFQSLKITLDTPGTESETHESETVNGVKCVKHVVLWGGVPFYTYYASEKYDLPVKIIRGNGEKVIELRNIEDKEIDDAMFKVPEDFSLIKESEEKK